MTTKKQRYIAAKAAIDKVLASKPEATRMEWYDSGASNDLKFARNIARHEFMEECCRRVEAEMPWTEEAYLLRLWATEHLSLQSRMDLVEFCLALDTNPSQPQKRAPETDQPSAA